MNRYTRKPQKAHKIRPLIYIPCNTNRPRRLRGWVCLLRLLYTGLDMRMKLTAPPRNKFHSSFEYYLDLLSRKSDRMNTYVSSDRVSLPHFDSNRFSRHVFSGAFASQPRVHLLRQLFLKQILKEY